jgi:hypothetical protein
MGDIAAALPADAPPVEWFSRGAGVPRGLKVL